MTSTDIYSHDRATFRERIARLAGGTTYREPMEGHSTDPHRLTDQDVAAALAFVPAGLGREVLCALWWPDGARLSPAALDEAIGAKVRAEMDVRYQKLQAARMALHAAQEVACSRRVQMADMGQRELMRLENAAEEAKAQCWPLNPQMHVRIRNAVLDELARPNHCTSCGGRGHSQNGQLIVTCPECSGRGTVAVSDRTRAARIGKCESTYRRVWRGMYEWLYGIVRDAHVQAAREFTRALEAGLESAKDR